MTNISEEFLNLVSAESEMEFRKLLGENALQLENANATPERNMARFYTVSTILEQRKLRDLNRIDYDPQEIKVPEDLINSLEFIRFTTTDSDLVPGNPRTDKNPLNVPLAYVCEIATAKDFGGVDPKLIADASNILLAEVESRVHPKPKTGISGFLQKIMPRGDVVSQEAQLEEAKMINNIIQTTTTKPVLS